MKTFKQYIIIIDIFLKKLMIEMVETAKDSELRVFWSSR